MAKKILKHLKNKFIIVMIKNLSVSTVEAESGMPLTENLSFEGFLVDIDEDSVYLSSEVKGPVTNIIPRDNIGFYGLAKKELDDIKMPDDFNGEMN